MADPEELPFDPLPLMDNSRFGVAVRNAAGNAQPMVFAPVLGGQGSLMNAGDVFEFKMRMVSAPGSCSDTMNSSPVTSMDSPITAITHRVGE